MRLACALAAAAAAVAAAAAAEAVAPVTCGSGVKLRHASHGFRLHSHDIKWGSGSRGQSVTALDSSDDFGSMWTVREPQGRARCVAGDVVSCSSVVRLQHAATGRFLDASASHRAPLSRRHEVSATEGGAFWRVECDGGGSGPWGRGQPARLVHGTLGTALAAPRAAMFDDRNCRGCPIRGQLEVSAARGADDRWRTDEGVYFAAREGEASSGGARDEL